MIDLTGKTILIAGAAGRIGQQIVQGALNAGAKVVAADRDMALLQTLWEDAAQGDRLRHCTMDIADAVSIASAFERGVGSFGSVEGAVNTAYPRNERYGAHFFDVTYADFTDNVGQHLGGYFLFMQQCAQFARVRECEFALVNLSSIYGSMAPRFEVYADTMMTMPVEYAAIKAGLMHMTRYVNAYMKGTAFRANCVSPGGILAGQDPRFLERYARHTMRKGMLEAQDVVEPILYALSDSSRFMVGQDIVVDDGFSL